MDKCDNGLNFRREESVGTRAIAGVDPDLLSVDVHAPASAPCNAPVVMWVHGGGYTNGDKANRLKRLDRDHSYTVGAA